MLPLRCNPTSDLTYLLRYLSALLRENLLSVDFPLICLRRSREFGLGNNRLSAELSIDIQYQQYRRREVTCFVVGNEDAHRVCQFLLSNLNAPTSNMTKLKVNLRLEFNVKGEVNREKWFVAIIEHLHGIGKVEVVGLRQNQIRKELIASMQCKRTSPAHWIAYGRACQSCGSMSLEVYSRYNRSHRSFTLYSGAMEAFDRGWRDVRQAMALPCTENDRKTLKDLYMWFGCRLAQCCNYGITRAPADVQSARTSLWDFLEDGPVRITSKELLRVLHCLATAGLESGDRGLALFALVECLQTQPESSHTFNLLEMFEKFVDDGSCMRASYNAMIPKYHPGQRSRRPWMFPQRYLRGDCAAWFSRRKTCEERCTICFAGRAGT